MDPSAFKYLSRDHIYPRNVHLNPFQNNDSHPMPGIYGAASGYPTYFVPMSQPNYELSKKSESKPPIQDVQDVTVIPSVSVNASAQLPQQKLINQVGFGNKNENSDSEIETNIDSESLKEVPQTVLSAFENPSMSVSNTTYNPKEKKLLSQVGKGNGVKKTYTKKSQISKMKFI